MRRGTWTATPVDDLLRANGYSLRGAERYGALLSEDAGDEPGDTESRRGIFATRAAQSGLDLGAPIEPRLARDRFVSHCRVPAAPGHGVPRPNEVRVFPDASGAHSTRFRDYGHLLLECRLTAMQ